MRRLRKRRLPPRPEPAPPEKGFNEFVHNLPKMFTTFDGYDAPIRALITEYGSRAVADAMATTNSMDPARIEKFCLANRRKLQDRMEKAAADWDLDTLRDGFTRGTVARRI